MELYAILAPIGVLSALVITDLFIQMKNELIEYVLMTILLILGIFITYEGSTFNKYQFDEIWLIFYCLFLVISISCWFHWKRMVLLYWIIQVINFIVLHLTYEKLTVFFYPGYIFTTILLPLVSMVIAKIILTFLTLIYKNQKLVSTIRKILQIFPESILIQSLDQVSGKLIVQFVNDTAAKEIIEYGDPCGEQIKDSQLKYSFKFAQDCNNFIQSLEEENKLIQSLSSLLELHVEKVQFSEKEAISTIKLWHAKWDDDMEEWSMCRHYNVKTVQLKLGVNKFSFIHVFINTTTIKQFEIEKTRNDCLQLMFSSISHEFRTPLNAFSNSSLLLESNYNDLLQKLSIFVPKEIVSNIISQSRKETNERFFKICKISTASLLSLIEDILDLTKIEAGTFLLNKQLFTVRTLVQDIESIFSFQCSQKGINFKIAVDRDTLKSSFNSDVGRIKQVLMNLISNSLKFTQDGGKIL